MKATKHYPIGQVCKLTDLPHSTIRFWEKTFSGLKPSRSSGGHRYYSAEQVALITLIKKLLHEDGHTIEGAKKYLTSHKNKSDKVNEKAPDSPQMDDITKLFIKTELQAILEFLNKW